MDFSTTGSSRSEPRRPKASIIKGVVLCSKCKVECDPGGQIDEQLKKQTCSMRFGTQPPVQVPITDMDVDRAVSSPPENYQPHSTKSVFRESKKTKAAKVSSSRRLNPQLKISIK